MALWNKADLENALKVTVHGDINASGVEIDSRRIKNGDIFIAIKGENTDGHKHLKQAFENGAVTAIVSDKPDEDLSFPCVMVPDTFAALTKLGEYARNRLTGKVIGITGSIGKTSVKEICALAFSALGKTYCTKGNFNNHFGLPLTLANMPPDTGYAVIEMGMNHAGEIAYLTAIAKPHIAIITNVEAVHLEYFSSVDAIADAKAEIFGSGSLAQWSVATAILNRDNKYYEYLAAKASESGVGRVASFGKSQGADARLLRAENHNLAVSILGDEFSFSFVSIYQHQAVNTLPALAAVYALGLDYKLAARSLAEFRDAEGRGRLHNIKLAGKSITMIDDSYNASPASMRAALEALANYDCKGGKIAVLGDMLELGDKSPEFHRELASTIDKAGLSVLVTCGNLMQNLHDSTSKNIRRIHAGSIDEIPKVLASLVNDDDVILIKGSHGSGMYKVVYLLKN